MSGGCPEASTCEELAALRQRVAELEARIADCDRDDIPSCNQAQELFRIERDLVAGLTTATTLEQALELSMDAAMAAAGLECAGVYLLDEAGNLHLASAKGLSDEFLRRVAYYEAGSPHGRLVHEGRPIFLGRDEFPPAMRDLCDPEGLILLAGLPVRHEGKVVAWINVASRKASAFTPWAKDALVAIAAQIGGTLLRIRAEEARAKSEAEFRNLFENMPDTVFVVDRQGTILFVNRGVRDIPPEKLVGTSGFSHMKPEHIPACREAFAQALRGEVASVVMEDIYGIWWDCRLLPVPRVPYPERVLVISADITAQKAAEERSARDALRLKRVLDMHERDRHLTACEIHDALAQRLVAAHIRLEAALQQARELRPEGPCEAFEEAAELLREVIAEANRLMAGLRPSILDDFGLEAAIDSLVNEGSRPAGRDIDYSFQLDAERLVAPLETTVFRIVQEALLNIRRHSRSPRARLVIRQEGDRLRLEIEDFGVGFDPAQVPGDRFGLEAMRTRCEAFGGRLEIHSAIGQGTRLYVELPVIEVTS